MGHLDGLQLLLELDDLGLEKGEIGNTLWKPGCGLSFCGSVYSIVLWFPYANVGIFNRRVTRVVQVKYAKLDWKILLFLFFFF